MRLWPIFALCAVALVALTGASAPDGAEASVSIPLMGLLAVAAKMLWELHTQAVTSKARHESQEKRLESIERTLNDLLERLEAPNGPVG